MTAHSPANAAASQQALARAVGLTAFVFGYPLIETYRTCRLQSQPETSPRPAASGLDGRAPINTLHSAQRPSTDEDRDIVTPANDLLYTTGWISLAGGPQILHVPSSQTHHDRYFVLALYDAYTENFENLGPRNSAPAGEDVLLVGPGGQIPDELKTMRVVNCPTNLVWLIGRILVGDEPDWPAARQLQADITLRAAPGTQALDRPPAVEQWQGEPVNAMAAILEHGEDARAVAPAFFTNLCHALTEAPGQVADQGMLAWFRQSGIMAGNLFVWDALDEGIRTGLIEGFMEGVHLVASVGHQRPTTPWVKASATGRYGTHYLARARTAYLGLGALATSEAIYAASHVDAHKVPFDGRRRYSLQFNAGDLPPADAFWSITLYADDRFLHPNSMGRHSIGDRTPGLRHEADGSLVIDIGNEARRDMSNWLPAPEGAFYLVLRMYHPRESARQWRIPALQVMENVA